MDGSARGNGVIAGGDRLDGERIWRAPDSLDDEGGADDDNVDDWLKSPPKKDFLWGRADVNVWEA